MKKKMENKYIITIIAVIIIISAIMVVITNNNSQNRPNDELVVCIAAHGGEPESGFNPMTGWGKRDDEDEYAFWNRCFSMARKMRRSGPGRRR